jgi:hypothetical protein
MFNGTLKEKKPGKPKFIYPKNGPLIHRDQPPKRAEIN